PATSPSPPSSIAWDLPTARGCRNSLTSSIGARSQPLKLLSRPFPARPDHNILTSLPDPDENAHRPQGPLLMPRKRKFIFYVATSADGFIARTDGSVDWLDRPQARGSYGMGAFYRSIDTCVMGRRTYEQAVKFGMPDGYSGKKNYVLSRTLKEAASSK